MDAINAESSYSDCELVAENDVATSAPPPSTKRKKQQNSKPSKKRKVGKPPRAPAPTPSVSEPPSLVGRKKRSKWWDHYQASGTEDVAECIYCHKHIGCASVNGTGPLRNHINTCKQYPANIDKRQKLIDLESKTRVSDDGSVETVSIPKLWEFNQDVIRKALAKMLIVDELPFSFVERDGFREYCKTINPHFFIPSRSTATRDCYKLFIEGRKKLLDIFQNMSSRVCLTTDTWTSGQNLSYMCLTAHFIDDDWHLHKRIINFCPIAGHSGVLIGRAVEKCLVEWGIRNVLTVTVDNASSNDLAIQHLKTIFNHWECGVLEGSFLHMRCAAHILNLVVKDGLSEVIHSVKKVRAFVRYVRSSPARLNTFKSSIQQEKIESKSLVCMDVETRWNSTFLMLDSAVKFKKAFSNMLLKDSTCKKELQKNEGGLVNDTDWLNVSSLLSFLKIFYDATLRLSGSRYVTSNDYIHEIFGIGSVISGFTRHPDHSICSMASKMLKKYKKYWGSVKKLNQFLFVALILDPRRKWQYIEWIVRENFDELTSGSFLDNLMKNMRSLFDMYNASMPKKGIDEEVVSSSKSPSFANDSDLWGNEVEMDIEKLMTQKFEMSIGSAESNEKKTELDKYIGEDHEPKDPKFDILNWWRVQQCRYPVLAKMAKDILAIPVSTVASESAFSTGGRVLDTFRTSLTPRMVEALVCTQDWLRASRRTPIILEDTFRELEILEEES